MQNQAKATTTITSTSYGIAAAGAATSGSGTTGSFGLVMLSKFLIYLRYLDLNYPDKMLAYFSTINDASFSLGLPMPEEWEEDFPQEDVPRVFKTYNVHSSFMVNYWATFSTLLIVVALALLLTLITYFA